MGRAERTSQRRDEALVASPRYRPEKALALDEVGRYNHGYVALGVSMPNTYTAITKKRGGWWIGWIEEVPGVNCQERTREELLETLRVTLKEMIDFNRAEAIQAAAPDYTEEPLTV